MRETPYHKIIPERIALLESLQKQVEKRTHTNHFSITTAKRKFSVTSCIINPKGKETILITAGCHGNEPAPVYAVNEFLHSNISSNKRLVILPCICPEGFAFHHYKNPNGKNINRNFFSKKPERETALLIALVKKYKPQVVVNLHEDPDESKFFLYLEGEGYEKKAKRIITLAKKHMSVYKRKKIHNDTVIDGIIRPVKKSTSFEDYLTSINIPNLCIETPGLESLEKRIQLQKKIIKLFVKTKQ